MVSFSSFQERISSTWQSILHSESHKYTRRILMLTFVGFFLRFIAARNLEVLADDMVYASQSAGIMSSGVISTHSNPPLFFYLTDLAYTLLGYTTVASRFWPLMAGTLLIPLTYLICNHLLKDKKASFFAALFVAASSFLIRMTFTEQSLVVLFFIFSGVYAGMIFMNNPKISSFILLSVLFGISLLTKYNAPFFILSFGIYALWYTRSHKVQKITAKKIVYLVAILLLFSLPFISFNYLLYKQKGIVDVYFSRLVHLNSTQELYGDLGGQENSFFDNIVKMSNYGNYNLPFMTDKLLVLFAVYGLWIFFKNKNRNALVFISLFLLIPFILQSAGAPLAKHFSFMYLVLAIPAGKGLSSLIGYLRDKKALRISLYVVIALAFIFSLGIAYGTPFNYFSKGPTSQLKSFINEEVSDNSLLIFDSRIYTARSMWLATDKAYLTFEQTPAVFEQISTQASGPANTKVYFIECVVEDCGWGWVANNQNVNISSEAFVNSISADSDIVKRINYKIYSGNELFSSESQEYYRVYMATLRIPTPYLEQIKRSQSFYFVPYLYKNMNGYIFDYKTVDPFASLLDNSSYFIIIISIIWAILSLFVVLFLLTKTV